MKNVIVDEWSAADLRVQVDKVLRGLGRPEPPLDLALVRELQRLDRQYYSSTDNSAAREFVSRLRVGVKQVIERPTLLWDVIRKADLRALYLPDRKRILIDSDTPEKKQRWAEAHEVGHSLARGTKTFFTEIQTKRFIRAIATNLRQRPTTQLANCSSCRANSPPRHVISTWLSSPS